MLLCIGLSLYSVNALLGWRVPLFQTGYVQINILYYYAKTMHKNILVDL